MAKIEAPYVEVEQGDRQFIVTKLPAKIIAEISYVAVRGQSKEKGAIQRILNPRRISSIKEFTLKGGDYPNAIILNWVNKKNPLERKKGIVSFALEGDSAQIIDGQHRVAGLKAAIEEQEGAGDIELPVVIYEQLSTKECADIFLSINTEQKPVPPSLVFDLYGVASGHVVDPAAVRARDIAMMLNDDKNSPYSGQIKFPGAPTRKGGVALSTVVTAIKPLVEEKGVLEQVEIKELELQAKIVLNLFKALQEKYGDQWDDKSNVFLYAAGFMGAMEFLKLKLVPYCNSRGSFSTSTISLAMALSKKDLILQEEVKGLGGRDSPKHVYDRLVKAFEPKVKVKDKFDF